MENPSGTPAEIDLEKMFAYLQIRRWIVELKGAKGEEEANQLKYEIVEKAKKHGFVTKYTSMVVQETPSEIQLESITVAPTQATQSLPYPSYQYNYQAPRGDSAYSYADVSVLSDRSPDYGSDMYMAYDMTPVISDYTVWIHTVYTTSTTTRVVNMSNPTLDMNF